MSIAWRTWTDDVAAELAALKRPIFCVVDAPDNGFVAPFLRALLPALEADARTAKQLAFFPALRVDARAIPPLLAIWGAGSSFHVALLSPHGFNPMATFEPSSLVGEDGMDVSGIARALERIADLYGG